MTSVVDWALKLKDNYLSIYLSVYMSICLSQYLSIHLSVRRLMPLPLDKHLGRMASLLRSSQSRELFSMSCMRSYVCAGGLID